MYILYIDDSGSISNPNEEYFVLGGVCVPERSISWLTRQLDELAETLDSANPNQIEFHASEIFGGRKPPWNQFKNKSERVDIIKKSLDVLKHANSDTVAFACAVHKASYPNRDLMKIAFEDLCSRFDMYLNRIYHEARPQYSHKGIIVFDKNAYENSLQSLLIEFRQQGTRWRDVKNIREVPFFVDSKASRLIQLADHIAYSVFRRYNAGDITYFNCIEDRFDTYQGVVHGLSHKQFTNPNCTCPACITRRNHTTSQ
ncbi:MAG TPA: DUF3800 domain-containing protein [Desulfobulbus sp.]|nr:DUF3800 domain-containing protein [Desulfobulbus sp.]